MLIARMHKSKHAKETLGHQIDRIPPSHAVLAQHRGKQTLCQYQSCCSVKSLSSLLREAVRHPATSCSRPRERCCEDGH